MGQCGRCDKTRGWIIMQLNHKLLYCRTVKLNAFSPLLLFGSSRFRGMGLPGGQDVVIRALWSVPGFNLSCSWVVSTSLAAVNNFTPISLALGWRWSAGDDSICYANTQRCGWRPVIEVQVHRSRKSCIEVGTFGWDFRQESFVGI